MQNANVLPMLNLPKSYYIMSFDGQICYQAKPVSHEYDCIPHTKYNGVHYNIVEHDMNSIQSDCNLRDEINEYFSREMNVFDDDHKKYMRSLDNPNDIMVKKSMLFSQVILEQNQTRFKYVTRSDLQKRLPNEETFVNFINFVIYEANLLFKIKEKYIFETGEIRVNSTQRELVPKLGSSYIFINSVMSKHFSQWEKISVRAIQSDINRRIMKLVNFVSSCVQNGDNDFQRYLDSIKTPETFVCCEQKIYATPSGPSISFRNLGSSVSVGMGRNYTSTSISFGLG
jgi:hypothetical protein